jgi:hypothetical protein
MLHKHKSLTRLLTAGLAIAAIAPAAAVAQPIDSHGQGTGVTKHDVRVPDRVAPGTIGTPSNGAPQWPTNPQTIAPAKPTAATKASDSSGIDTGAWIAIGAAAFVATAGLGLVGLKRVRTTRQRQPA